MTSIGSFKRVSPGQYEGEIITLALYARNVRIVPEPHTSSNKDAPTHRVTAGKASIGAGWSKRSEQGRDYLSIKLDDPSFIAPLWANLIDDENSDTATLLWSRRTKAKTK